MRNPRKAGFLAAIGGVAASVFAALTVGLAHHPTPTQPPSLKIASFGQPRPRPPLSKLQLDQLQCGFDVATSFAPGVRYALDGVHEVDIVKVTQTAMGLIAIANDVQSQKPIQLTVDVLGSSDALKHIPGGSCVEVYEDVNPQYDLEKPLPHVNVGSVPAGQLPGLQNIGPVKIPTTSTGVDLSSSPPVPATVSQPGGGAGTPPGCGHDQARLHDGQCVATPEPDPPAQTACPPGATRGADHLCRGKHGGTFKKFGDTSLCDEPPDYPGKTHPVCPQASSPSVKANSPAKSTGPRGGGCDPGMTRDPDGLCRPHPSNDANPAASKPHPATAAPAAQPDPKPRPGPQYRGFTPPPRAEGHGGGAQHPKADGPTKDRDNDRAGRRSGRPTPPRPSSQASSDHHSGGRCAPKQHGRC